MEDTADELSSALGHEPPLRPVVGLSLGHLELKTPHTIALVDSGSERTLAGPALARTLDLNLDDAPHGLIGIGGASREVRFATVELYLYEHLFRTQQSPIANWEAQVGFLTNWNPPWSVVLGQRGFFDKFTVTMHRSATAVALENWEVFDERFGVVLQTKDVKQPRFKP
jgi:hypothetical protein